MGLFDRLFLSNKKKEEHRMSHIGYHANPGIVSKKAALESHPYSAYGQLPEITMKEITKYYLGSPRFQMAVQLHVEEAVGHGYYITCEEDNSSSKAALKLIDEFDRDFNLNNFNRYVATEMFMAGNSFMTPLKFQGKTVSGLDHIPLSSIVSIYQRDGMTIHYRQQTNNSGLRTIMAENMLHFSYNRFDASPWGRSIGQNYCAPGVPYKSPEGKNITPPSQAESDSFADHLSIMIQYAGLPKYLALLTDKITPEDKNTLARELTQGSPLSSIVLGSTEGKVETLGMTTQGKLGDQQQRVHENSILALMAPEIALWDTANVQAYASSQEVAKSIQPMIIGYKMAHARFIEHNVLKPIIDHAMGENYWDKLGMKLNWGQPDTRDLDSIYKAALLLQHKIMKDVINPKDILSWLKEAGYETTPPDPELVAKREERERAMQEAMTGKKQENEEKKKEEEEEEKEKGAVGVGSTKPSDKPGVKMSQKMQDKAQEIRAKRIFYQYIENKYALDGNDSKK